eukprot:TRINITY_DN37541_c0_g1_i1.p1 TRINITY_DN37541_c0_g1~~TRINITY_DN37541_c0_g1_i1.p1  ORF type:complete len:469 (+),score=66.84 TRINITY_DN37541_c0_g1_i1:67-1473(+)
MSAQDGQDFLGSVFRSARTVWPRVVGRCSLFLIYSVAVRIALQRYLHDDVRLGSEVRSVLFGLVLLMLAARISEAQTRFQEGEAALTRVFGALRELVLLGVLFPRGGIADALAWEPTTSIAPVSAPQQRLEDAHDRMTRRARVDVVRLVIATGVSLQLHARMLVDGYRLGKVSRETRWHVDWDRLRLKQLLLDEEFSVLDRAVGFLEGLPVRPAVKGLIAQFRGEMGVLGPQKPPADWPRQFEVVEGAQVRPYMLLVNLIRETFHAAKFDPVLAPWGVKQRYIADATMVLGRIEHSMDHLDRIITASNVFLLANFCKTHLLLLLHCLPLSVARGLSLLTGASASCMIALALLAADAVALEIQDPFSGGSVDGAIVERLSSLESEAMEALALTGCAEARRYFCWRMAPPFVRERSPSYVRKQLAFVEAAAPEIVPPVPGAPEHEDASSDSDAVGGSQVNSLGSSLDLGS